jgi:hypothetical protein
MGSVASQKQTNDQGNPISVTEQEEVSDIDMDTQDEDASPQGQSSEED